MTKTTVVYWSPYTIPSDVPKRLLWGQEPKQFLPDLRERQKDSLLDSHFMCPSVKQKHKNTFIADFTYDVNVYSYNDEIVTKSPFVSSRPGVYPNSFAFDVEGFNRVFFSEESLVMQTSPAYYHQTSYSNLGHVPSGQFDIGQWFRPSAPTIQCFSNVGKFEAKENEPLMYFNFLTDNKVELKPFMLTQTLYDISQACVSLKFKNRFLPLKEMYSTFTKSNLKKIIIKEIKANLL